MFDVESADANLLVSANAEPGGLRVLLIADSTASPADLRSAIALGGHRVVAHADSIDQGLALASDCASDVALVVSSNRELASARWCLQLQAGTPMPVVLMAWQVDDALLSRADAACIYGCVSPNTSPEMLSATLSLAFRRFQADAGLRAERDRLADQARQLLLTLENRKLIERAKGIYMRLLGLQEGEAHRRLQQESQRRRLSIADLAKKIIESDELLGSGH